MEYYYLGIDIGATAMRGIAMRNLSDKKPQHIQHDTPENKKDFFTVLEELMVSLAGDKKISGIGVGIRGIVDSQKAILVKDERLPFLNGWKMKPFFERFGAAVKADNDSRCFLRGEAGAGAARGYQNVIGLAIGTGIGGGIMIDGKIYRGRHNAAGEFGRMILDGGKTFEMLAAKEAFLRHGDRSTMIGIGVAGLINAFDPDSVVLGGGGVASGGVNIATVKKVAKQFILSPLSKKTPVVKGSLSEWAQAMGAAMLFAE